MAFNSAEYAWKDITVFIDGNPIGGIQNIQYTSATENDFIYGRGSKPRAIQDGNESYTGSISLFQSEYEALREAVQAAGYKNVTKPFFTISVAYNIGTILQVDNVQQLRIEETPKELSQNDKQMILELSFKALDVKENV